MSWNGHPLQTSNSFFKRLRNDTKTNGNDEKKKEKKMIWVTLHYFGHMRNKMKERCFTEVQKCLTEGVYFFTRYETKKVAMFCSAKDTIPTLQKSNVFYC